MGLGGVRGLRGGLGHLQSGPRSALQHCSTAALQHTAHLLLLVGGRGVRQHGAAQCGYVWICVDTPRCCLCLPLPCALCCLVMVGWCTVHCTLHTQLCSSCTAVCCTLQYSVHCSQTNKYQSNYRKGETLNRRSYFMYT